MTEQTLLQGLLQGESPLKNAPPAQLSNGAQCIPQHYLKFNHNDKTVNQIIMDIEYDDRYPIFVCQDQAGLYIQIGIIGFDNYKLRKDNSQKIVYGRKWRVEPELPTSEIIQTVFLALKKAREHEVRELFCLTLDGRKSTPFNNHHDLPLMARHTDLLQPSVVKSSEQSLRSNLIETLEKIRYDSARLELKSLQKLDDQLWFVEVFIDISEHSLLPELKDTKIQLLLSSSETNAIYYTLMEYFIGLSDQHINEHFTYRGFTRFSQKNSIEAIAELSVNLRQKDQIDSFQKEYEASNYQTDLTRVPRLDNSAYAHKVRAQLEKHQPLDGILPRDMEHQAYRLKIA